MLAAKRAATFIGLIGALVLAVVFVMRAWPHGDNEPIEFFGRIVDDRGTPVGGAEVNMVIYQEKLWTTPDALHTTNAISVQCRSDSDGVFALRGIYGWELTIRSIRKYGHSWDPFPRRQSQVFLYRANAARGYSQAAVHRPDAGQPVRFTMTRD